MSEEDLIQLRLIEGMYNASHWYKILEQLQIGNISLNTCIDFIQQQELVQEYKHKSTQLLNIRQYLHVKKDKKMFVLWTWTWNKQGKMPSIWEVLYKLLKKKKNHFQTLCKFKKEKHWKSWRKQNQYASLYSKKQKQECRKNWTKEKTY